MEFDSQCILTSELLLDSGSALFAAAAQAAAAEAFEDSPEWFRLASGRAGFRLPSPNGASAHELLEARMSIQGILSGLLDRKPRAAGETP